MPKSKAKIDRAAFERQIEGYDEEYRNELRVEQITPVFADPGREALLPIRAGHESDASAWLAELAERVRNFFHLETADQRNVVRLGHDSDRIYAGYENIYRAICKLAPHVEDCRFIIEESYDTWVDEYRIRDGELEFERGHAENEFITDLQNYLESEAKRRSDDRDLVAFVARFLAGSARYYLDRAEHPSIEASERKEASKNARGLLDRCVRLDENQPTVLAQMGRLLRVEKRPAEAKKWFERHIALVADAKVMFATALASLEEGDREQARGWFERLADAHPNHWATRMMLVSLCEDDRARAHARHALELSSVLTNTPQDQRDQLHRSGHFQAVIDAFLRHASVQSEEQRKAMATQLVVWAALVEPNAAERYYGLALELGPASTAARYAWASFLRKAGRADEHARQLDEILTLDPNHIETVADLGRKAFDEERWLDAISLLERAVQRSIETKTGSYARGVHAGQLANALINEGNRMLDRGEYEAADAIYQRAVTLSELMHWTEWPAPLLRRSAAHTYMGRHEQALAFAEQALALASDSVHAMSEVASCLNNLGRLDDALAACDLAEELDADGYWHIPYVRACILSKGSGSTAEIVRLLAQSLERDEVVRSRIREDPDLDRVRNTPEFQTLLDSKR